MNNTEGQMFHMELFAFTAIHWQIDTWNQIINESKSNELSEKSMKCLNNKTSIERKSIG